VDGPQCSRPFFSLGIDTYGIRAGTGDTGASLALTEDTGEATAYASTDDSIGRTDPKHASPAIPRLGALNGGDVRIARIKNL